MPTEKRVIYPPGAKPGGNWSYGILTDGTLYISGMGGEDADGKIPATFEAEVQQSLDNIGTVLKAAGMSPADVVSVQVYLTDRNMFERMNSKRQCVHVRAIDGAETTVLLTDKTKVSSHGVGEKAYPVIYIMRGLRLQALDTLDSL